MPIKIITIPFEVSIQGFDSELLDQFCMNKVIHQLQAQFFTTDSGHYWTFMIQYDIVEGKGESRKHGEVTADLDEGQKLLYENLRIWRKQRANQEGIPVYLIAKNAHLVLMVKKRVLSMKGFDLIKGFGKMKREKYGKDIIHIIQTFYQTS